MNRIQDSKILDLKSPLTKTLMTMLCMGLIASGCKAPPASKTKSVKGAEGGQSSFSTQTCGEGKAPVDFRGLNLQGFDKLGGEDVGALVYHANSETSKVFAAAPKQFLDVFMAASGRVDIYNNYVPSDAKIICNTVDTGFMPSPQACYRIDNGKSGNGSPVISLFINSPTQLDLDGYKAALKGLVHSYLIPELVFYADNIIQSSLATLPNISKLNDKDGNLKQEIDKYKKFKSTLASTFITELSKSTGSPSPSPSVEPAKSSDTDKKASDNQPNTSPNANILEELKRRFTEDLAVNPDFQTFLLAELVDAASCSDDTKKEFTAKYPLTEKIYSDGVTTLNLFKQTN